MTLNVKTLFSIQKIRNALFLFVFVLVLTFMTALTASSLTEDWIEAEATITAISLEEDEYTIDYTDEFGNEVKGAKMPYQADNDKVGDTLKILINANDPTEICEDNRIITYVLIGVDAILIIFFIIQICKVVTYFKRNKENKQNNSEMEEKIKKATNPEDLVFDLEKQNIYKYCADDTGNKKIIIKDEQAISVYEISMTQKSLLSASTFEFRNNITGKATEHNIGKTISFNQDQELVAASKFKFDGMNCQDYIHSKGLEIKTEINNPLAPEYRIMKYNIQIAYCKTIELNHSMFMDKNVMREVMQNGFYTFYTKEENIEDVVLCLFYISKTGQYAF